MNPAGFADGYYGEQRSLLEIRKMRRAVISSKGRVTIPAKLRKKLGFSPGIHVEWSKKNGKLVLTPVSTRRIEKLERSLKT
jgi:AbrB family looped-hinge helix DNA binding protein